MKSPANTKYQATGKRKSAIAQVRLDLSGENKFVVNGKTLEDYFGNHPFQKNQALKPLASSKLTNTNISVVVTGGGLTGQADAILNGLAKAIGQTDPKLRKLMRHDGFLTRDSRIVERKKPGRPKARKRFQFSKR